MHFPATHFRHVIILSTALAWVAPLAAQSGTALVRHAATVQGKVEGSLHQMEAEPFGLSGSAAITRDLMLPGTPIIHTNGSPTFGGAIDGTGNPSPSGYAVSIGGNATLGRIVRRTDPVAFPVFAAPLAPAGTRSLVLNSPADAVGPFATLRDLTLNGNVGTISVPAGAYGDFVATTGNGFTLGSAGAGEPAVYHFQKLILHARAELRVLGPVVVNVANGVVVTGMMGAPETPGRLALNLHGGALTVNGGGAVHAFVKAPDSTVTIGGGAQIIGGFTGERLVIHGGGLLRLTNRPPEAGAATVAVTEDVSIQVLLTASDPDGDPLAFSVVSPPDHGTLTGTPPRLTYLPAANYAGADAFRFKASDGHVDSNVATVTLAVAPVNDRPTADAKSLGVIEDTSGVVSLSGADVDGDTLRFEIVTPPRHGSLSGEGSDRTYMPAADYHGPDAFTYITTDGTLRSEAAVVAIAVAPVNDAPVAWGARYDVNEGDTVAITLAATDVEGDTLSFLIVAAPTHGTLTGTAPNLIYRPNPNYDGADALTFKVNDGRLDSPPATITVAVTNLNFAPVARAGAASTDEDVAVTVTLSASDADSDALVFAIVTPPQHGSLGAISAGAGNTATVTYTPAANYHGSDAFTFKVRDGELDSVPATVALTVRPVNDPPVATAQSVAVIAGVPKAIALTATDADGDPLTYSITSVPAHGTLTGTAPAIVYTAAADYAGDDSFVFKVNDGHADSAPATVGIVVAPPPNRPPRITSSPVATMELRGELGTSGVLRGTIRDFSKNHPNFEEPMGYTVWVSTELVEPFLGADRKPKPFRLGQPQSGTDTAENFNQWFRDVPGVNFSRPIELPIAETAPGSGIYSYRSDAFFPIDNEFHGSEGLTDGQTAHNFLFTCEYHTQFIYRPGQSITFRGDDSVWVFVDDRLVIDLGGVHVTVEGTANLDHLGLIPGRVYPMDIFHAEQHTGGSSFGLQTNMGFEMAELYRYAVQATDPDGEPMTYALTQAPAGMKIDPQSGVLSWQVNRSLVGTHPVTVEVRDAGGLTGTQSYSLELYVNSPPTIAWAGRYHVGRVGEPLALAANVTDDGNPRGKSLALMWSKLSGPGEVAFSTAGAASANATFSALGIYVLQMRADDGSRETTSTVEVRIDTSSASAVGQQATSWWPGNDTPEDVVSGRHGLALFGAGYSTGVVGSAFTFDGVNDIVRVPANPDLDVGAAPAGFSIQFWMRCEIDTPMGAAFGWRTVIGQPGPDITLDNYLGSRRLSVNLRRPDGTAVGVGGEQLWPLNQWVHLAFTYDRASGVARLYRDGGLKIEQGVGPLALQTAMDLWWGCLSGINGNYFRGKIDEVAVHRRPLSDAEVYASFATAGAGNLPPSGNQPPVANAGADLAPRGIDQPITLAGAATDDGRPANGTLRTQWSLVSGPGTPTIAAPSSLATAVTLPAPGTYVFKLTASDGEAVSSDLVQVNAGQIVTARPAGLVAWWPGNDAASEMIRGLHGTWNNAPAYAAGTVASAFAFDGQRRVSVPASPELNGNGWDGLSLEFWLRPTTPAAGGNGGFLSWRNPSGSTGVTLRVGYYGGWLVAVDLPDTNGGAHSFSFAGLTMDQWQHFVIAYERATGVARVYRNGTQLHEAVLGSFTPQTSLDLHWGNVTDASFRGSLDELSIYRRALASDEAHALYQAGAAGKEPAGPNLAPLVNAGPDRIVRGISETVTLAGSASDDALPAGNGMVARWSKLSGPGAVTFGNPALAATSAMFAQPGIYVVQLEADDGLTRSVDTAEIKVGPFTAADAPSDLVAWWTGNHTTQDSVGGQHAQWIGSPAFTAGAVGAAFEFDGARRVRVPASTVLNATTWPGLSLEFWVRPSGMARVGYAASLLEWRQPAGQTGVSVTMGYRWGWNLVVNLTDTAGQGHSLGVDGALVEDGWQHLVIAYDRASGRAQVFRNGQPVAERNLGTFTPQIGYELLWANAGDNRFIGGLDELSIYRRALQAGEALQLFAAGASGKIHASDNTSPQVAAGSDVVLPTASATTTLAGTVADDGKPFGPPSVQWRMREGPGTVTFANPNLAGTTATFSAPGVYMLELTASDSLTSPVSDVVEVRVGVAMAEPVDGIAAWWPANLHGREVISGNAPVALANGAGYSTGKVLSGFLFDGVDDYGRVNAHADIDVGGSPAGFTVEFWVKPAENRDGTILSWGDPGVGGLSLYQYAGGRELEVNFRERASGADRGLRTTGSALTGGEWSHLAVTHERVSGEMRIYVNGRVRVASTVGTAAVRTQFGLTFARNAWDSNWPWKGVLDEPALYRRALTPAEIAAIHLAGADGKSPPDDNAPPSVAAGPDVVLPATGTVTLAGSVIDDQKPFGAPDVRWRTIEGPDAVVFANEGSATTTANFSTAGTYLLELSGSDRLLAPATDVVEVRVGVATVEPPAGISAWWPATRHGREVVAGNAQVELWHGADFAPGKVLSGFVFDGVDDVGRVAPHADVDIGAAEAGFTVEFWVQPALNRDSMILSWGDRTAAGVAIYQYEAGREIEVNFRERATAADHGLRTSGYALSAGQWTHVAVTQDRATGEMRIYIDGKLRRSAFLGKYAVRTQFGLTFGANAWDAGWPWKGVLDELALYRRALTSSEIALIHAAGTSGKCPDLTNRTPVAMAGNDRELTALASVPLAGQATDDGRALPLRYQWSKISGPGTAQFGDATSLATNVTFDAIGRYELRLQAYDGLIVGSDTVAIWAGMPRAPDEIAVWWPADGHPREVIRGNHDVTFRNGASYGSGKVGQAFQFDGIDDYATVEAHADLDVGASAAGFTIEWWAKNRGGGTMLYWYAGGVYFQAGAALSGNLRAGNGSNYFFDAGGWAAAEKILLPLDVWTHLAVTFDRPTGTVRYYANGELKRTEVPGPNSALSTSGLATTGLFHLGVASAFFNGLLDEIALYSRPLAGTEIAAIYQSTNGGKAPPLSEPPVVAVVSPPMDAGLPAGLAVNLVASATDADGTIAQVEFLRDGVSLGLAAPVEGRPGIFSLTATFAASSSPIALAARATDNTGVVATSAAVTVRVMADSGPPFAEITTPDEDSRVTAPLAIKGVAASPLLAGWSLERRLKAAEGVSPDAWTVFASGNAVVGTPPVGSTTLAPGALGTFDPRLLLNGIHELRLTATDTAGRIQVAGPITLIVEGNMKVGAFTLAFEDLKVPVAGIPITLTRTYDSRDPRVGDFGPGWRLALNNIRVQKNRHLGTGWWQTPQQGSGLQFYYVEPVMDRLVTVVMPDGETHRFRAGALVKNREGDPDNASFTVVVRRGKYRFYPVGDTTSKLEPLNAAHELVEDFFIAGTGTQDLTFDEFGFDPFNTARYRLTTADGTVFIVDELLGLLEMRDTNGNRLALNRDPQNRVTGVIATQAAETGPITRTVSIVRDGSGRVDFIRDLAGKELDYLYDDRGRLASFVNREMNVTQFRYERSDSPSHPQFHYLTRVIDPRGVAALRSEYDTDGGRLLKQIDADGRETVFNGGVDTAGRFEKVRDRLGQETTFYYDERGNVTLKLDPLGAQTSYRYWPDGDRVKFETDHYGNVKGTAYDVRGNLTVETLGASLTDDPANPTTGFTTRTTYNVLSAPTRITDPDGRVQAFSYDQATNDLLTHTLGANPTDPAIGDRTTYTYNRDGTVATIADALGNVTRHAYAYNFSDSAYPAAVKQITMSVTDPAGAAGSDPGNPTETVLRSTRTVYDGQENQLAQIVRRTQSDGTAEDVVTRYRYDAEGRLRATIMPDGRVSETRYTSFGREEKTVRWQTRADYEGGDDAKARVTSFGYDARNNQISVTSADGTTELTGFDAENRKVWSQDRRGHRTFFVYDAVGRLRYTILPDANDGVGGAAPSVASDSRLADNPRSETQYDLAGRVRFQIDERGARTEFTYEDNCGCSARRKEMILHRAAGNLITRYGYDQSGNVRFVTDPRGNTVETRYDDRGRPRLVVYPATDENSVTQTETRYDALGRRIETFDQEGKVTRYRYDGLGRLVEVRQYLDQAAAPLDSEFSLAVTDPRVVSTRYTYDELGSQTAQIDALGRITRYQTDSLGRRIRRTLPADLADASALLETLTYDGWGNLWKRTDFAGQTTTFGYDPLNRLTSKAADSAHPSVGYTHAIARIEFEYDQNGGRKAARTYNGANTLLYAETTPRDERGRIDYKDAGSAGRLDYDYHANGLLKDVVSSNAAGVNIGFRYDELNRLEYVDDASSGIPPRTTTYSYNANGSLETIGQPNGIVHAYAYDALNRLRTLQVRVGSAQPGGPPTGTLHHTYEYKLRPTGHRRQVLEALASALATLSAPRTTTYDYDGLYRLTGESVGGDPNGINGVVGYTLDKVGNRGARTSSLAGVAPQPSLTYNVRDWLNGDTYSPNGSTVQGQLVDAALRGTDTYDFEERLIVRTRADGTSINISYDADGHRIAKNILSGTGAPVSSASWLVDTNNLTGYAQVFEERITTPGSGTTPGTTRQIVYTYGSDLISQASTSDSQPTAFRYFTYDGHGSTRELTGSNGAVTDRYDYDAFGQMVFRSGATSNAFLYVGEQYDADMGLYYLRARYWNPDAGRFWSMDSYEGGSGDPISLHKYAYGNANPATYRDPSGHVSLAEVQIGMVIVGTLNSLALNSGRNTINQANGIFSPTGELNTALATFEQAAFIYEQVSFAALAGGVSVLGKRVLEKAWTALAPKLAKALTTLQNASPGKIIQAQLGRFHRATATGSRYATRYEPTTGVLEDAAESAVPSAGQRVFRVYGGDSAAGGASWSPVNPANVPNFRNAAGLPSGGASGATNTGRFVIEGTLQDAAAVVKVRPALPLDGNAGGLTEYIIPNWQKSGAIRVDRVSGVNPEF